MAKTYNNDIQERTYRYAVSVVRLVETVPRSLASQVIGKQLIRSATSVGANIAEAKASSSRKDFINFYTYSLKSANESKYWLRLLSDTSQCDRDKWNKVSQETDEISRILASCILTLKGKNIKKDE